MIFYIRHLQGTARRPMRSAMRGFSLISAIFLLLVLAGLGVAIVNVSTNQHVSSALDVQGTRAYLAARAGIEWGVYRQLRNNSCAGPVSFSLPAGTTLAPFTVTVTCTLTPGAVPTLNQWQITAVACNLPTGAGCVQGVGGGTNFVQRVVQVRF